MPIELPDRLEEWSELLEQSVMRAAKKWSEATLGNVLPDGLRAAAAEEAGSQISLEAMLSTANTWAATATTEMAPAMIAFMVAQSWDVATARRIDLRELSTPATTPKEHRQAFAEAKKILHGWGFTDEQIDIVVTTRSWWDEMAAQLAVTPNKVVGVPDTIYRELVAKLGKATQDGATLFDRNLIVREFLDMSSEGGFEKWTTRASRIARTETHRVINAGTMQAARAEQQISGETLRKAWMCVAPETIINSPNAKFAARRKYDGTMVNITTASGRSIAVTPEHPVLTGRGWLPAGDVDLTDNLFQVVGVDSPVAPDVNDAPTGVGEVVDAVMDSMPAEVRSVRSGVNFNGDRAGGYVDVVPVNSLLADYLKPGGGEDLGQFRFVDADSLAKELLFSAGDFSFDVGGDFSSAVGVDGGLHSFGANFLRFFGRADNASLGLVSEWYPGVCKQPVNHVRGTTEGGSDGARGGAAEVHGGDGVGVDVVTPTRSERQLLGGARLFSGGGVGEEPSARSLPAAADGDAVFFEPAADCGSRSAGGFGDGGKGFAGVIAADDVVGIERYSYVGHVYDLSTDSGWYEANGLVLHNCTWDSRTRDDHFRADGQVVPIDGKFLIGGYEADYPGDPNLPAHLVVNCRCTHIILGEDESLPDNDDRQTERERRSRAEAGTTRVPQGEVTRRAERGVTRDADNQQLTAATKSAEEITMGRREWSGVLAPVGKPSGDGRILMEDAQINFRDFPLPLMFQKTQSEGHDTGVVVGKIEAGTVEGGAIHATGVLFDTPEALEAAELLAEEVIRPSVDLCDMVVDWVIMDADGDRVDDLDELDDWEGLTEQMQVSEATIMGATLVAKPAFAEAKIQLGDEATAGDDEEENALVAAAAVAMRYDSALFANPQLAGPTPLTVDGEHVFGHLALWGTEHMSFPGKGVQPPRSATNYALFHTSQLETDEGSLSVGRLTVGTGHATARDDVHAASEHYDTTGTTWAFVKAGEDKHGIWVSGVINPDAEASQVRAGAAAPLSGDWRRVGNNLELVAALSVNTPGFPVPRAFQNEGTESMSLVAAGVAPRLSRHDEMVAAVRDAIRADREERAAQEEKRERLESARAMAASVMASTISRGM